jgi:hypothetical protein
MIPDFNYRGELPPGIYIATLKEIEDKFVFNRSRKELFEGLKLALKNLSKAGVPKVYIDGSFVTKKPIPNDIDGCWDIDEDVDPSKLDPVFLDFSDRRKAMKEKYGVDFFIANTIELGSGKPFVAFFQLNRDGLPRGILSVELKG